METRLKAAGLKKTQARLIVLGAFAKQKGPVSAQELIASLGSPLADQSTVYRMLQSFVAAGLLREVNLRHDHVDYELADALEDHHHLVCLSCGLVEEFIGCDAEDLAKKALKACPSFQSVRDHAIELFGECKRCAKRPTSRHAQTTR